MHRSVSAAAFVVTGSGVCVCAGGGGEPVLHFESQEKPLLVQAKSAASFGNVLLWGQQTNSRKRWEGKKGALQATDFLAGDCDCPWGHLERQN